VHNNSGERKPQAAFAKLFERARQTGCKTVLYLLVDLKLVISSHALVNTVESPLTWRTEESSS
jgi:hypothetical protein